MSSEKRKKVRRVVSKETFLDNILMRIDNFQDVLETFSITFSRFVENERKRVEIDERRHQADVLDKVEFRDILKSFIEFNDNNSREGKESAKYFLDYLMEIYSKKESKINHAKKNNKGT